METHCIIAHRDKYPPEIQLAAMKEIVSIMKIWREKEHREWKASTKKKSDFHSSFDQDIFYYEQEIVKLEKIAPSETDEETQETS